MTWLAKRIKAIMIVSGGLTCTMILAAFDPQGSMSSTFGETLEGNAAELIVRNWGVLIALMGAMLLYGAFRPAARTLALMTAGASKAVFVGLVLAQGSRYLGHQAGIAVAVDSLTVLLFALYLATGRQRDSRV